MAERFGLGYLATGILFSLDSVPAFWLVYILTRPLGASFGDLLSQPVDYGGMGFGTVVTSLLFLGVIVLTVVWMTLTRRGEELVPAA